MQGTSVEPLVGAGSLDNQFQAFERVVALHPTMWDPSVCTKAAFAKGVNWVRKLLPRQENDLGVFFRIFLNILSPVLIYDIPCFGWYEVRRVRGALGSPEGVYIVLYLIDD